MRVGAFSSSFLIKVVLKNIEDITLQLEKTTEEPIVTHAARLTGRTALTNSDLAEVPFQLLPYQVHAALDLEKTLCWQKEFIEDLEEVPSFDILVTSGGDLVPLMQSLSVQSLLPKEVFVFGAIESLPPLPFPVSEMDGPLQALGQSDYAVVTGPRQLLHPEALFILAKQMMRGELDVIYTNQLKLSVDTRTALEFVRREALSEFSLLAANTVGETLVLDSKFLSVALARTEELSPTHATWALAASALEQNKRHLHVPLALFADRGEGIATEPPRGALQRLAREKGVRIEEFETQESRLNPIPSPSQGRVQVVIPFKNQSALTKQCIQALARQEIAEDLELCLVDNSSSLEERQRIENCLDESGLRGRFLEDTGYFNFARLNNLGCSSSHSEFILFLNNDVELLAADALGTLRDWCAQETVAVVGGELRYPGGSIQSAGINFASVRPMNVADKSFGAGRLREVDGVSFALAMVKREAYEEVHGLDELLCPNGFGDAVFCQTLRNRGWTVLATPDVIATHHESVSRGRRPEDLELLEMVQGGIAIADLYEDFSTERQPRAIPLQGGVGVRGFLAKNPRLKKFVKGVARGLGVVK